MTRPTCCNHNCEQGDACPQRQQTDGEVHRPGELLLGLLMWPLLLPLGVKRIFRILRRLVRKAIAPALLWLNAWQYKQSEEHVDYLRALRLDFAARESRKRIRQMKLRKQRDQIARW